MIYLLITALLLFISSISCLSFGELCDSSPIYSATWQYDDSCSNVYLFCDATKNNTCNYKTCSNTDYIQGWDEVAHRFPDRCNNQMYCPDNGAQCTPLVSPGGHCELQRDDECAGKESICLNSTCFIKGAPLGGGCGSDRTDYISYDAKGFALKQTIIRDNCTEGTYCDDNIHSCIASYPLDAACWQDRECLSGTCSDDGKCANGPDVFHSIEKWLWAVLGCSIFVFVILILGVLWVLHRYQSRKEHAKAAKFFGDNDEFFKRYQMQKQDSSYGLINNDSMSENPRASVVYLTTPDYQESAALGTSRPLNWRHSSNSANNSNVALSSSANLSKLNNTK